ncbi:Rpn family recombination-promoting nuclease/putative transposase [Candidatus Symbiopectobacterium sp. NZEC151]|uniref:Rpn family recombination-promoting nuclease/putative transposase n=1 Tax=Candidatus Symbiopectobacterium sp. NZEC151 TaxID=2820470 RepID=UPI00222736C5|nr:Rpn family recombination-promoting nuclease/putative transposase [Candidatus Symbiopectobacterium sp. NZEC151]MCW2474434.1 Rpn family recombination-promoting nuclease/putative transposase [Candidatus Symbiopectobacterium sp. NZEC151]
MKKSSNTPTPHDATFKQFLTNSDTARDFMQLHLPGELRELCDLTTLKLESGSFIEDDLRAYFSDVLYSVKTRVGEGYIHVLIEHQSSADKHMAFRLMRYAIAAMQKYLDAKHKTLPLVIPILFYAGSTSPYPYSTNWLAGFDYPDVAERLYSKPFPLVDVTVIPDDEIMEHRSMAALTLLQKHIRQRDLAELMDRLVTLLLAGYMTRQQTISLVNYMVEAGDALDVEAFVFELAHRVPQHEEELMTIAQRLEQKGMEKGGREAMLKVIRNMRQNGMDDAAVMKLTGLTKEELAKLR